MWTKHSFFVLAPLVAGKADVRLLGHVAAFDRLGRGSRAGLGVGLGVVVLGFGFDVLLVEVFAGGGGGVLVGFFLFLVVVYLLGSVGLALLGGRRCGG